MKLAVIPARGGSKRIPRKNIRSFLGKPIIAYSIEAAKQSGCFDKIIVSTDDEEIAEVARQYGAEVPFFRPAELSDDYTGTNDVVKHAINWYIDKGQDVEYACCIYATSPFLQARFLQQGLEKLQITEKAYAFSVTSFPFPIQRSIKITANDSIEAFYPEHIFTRSQDLEEAYHDAGQFYWGRASAYLNDEVLFSNSSIPIVLPRYLVQDIDTLEDWQRAEHMYKSLQLEGVIE
ncbi:MAG: pseudaminic acid cytidylyltransferase [Gammaproteobacteria bacterium]|nr:pseudaminic acid cytidylyltransferase [Gammaproteobacteria bacterium]